MTNTTLVITGTSGCTQTKKGFVRPKTAEPGSPLLRRALSPDRLHPRSAESKSISPLCSSGTPPVVKTQGRSGTSAVWRATAQPEREKESEVDSAAPATNENLSNSENRLSLNLSGPGELLPRIAEEKDSPTSGVQETKPKEEKKVAKSDKTKEESKKTDGKSGTSEVKDGNAAEKSLKGDADKVHQDVKVSKDAKQSVDSKASSNKPPTK